MTVGIVDALEKINVDDRQAYLASVSATSLQLLVEAICKASMVEEARQAVPLHHRTQPDRPIPPHSDKGDKAPGIDGLRDKIIAAKLTRFELESRLALA